MPGQVVRENFGKVCRILVMGLQNFLQHQTEPSATSHTHRVTHFSPAIGEPWYSPPASVSNNEQPSREVTHFTHECVLGGGGGGCSLSIQIFSLGWSRVVGLGVVCEGPLPGVPRLSLSQEAMR